MPNLQTSWHCNEAVTSICNHGDWLFAGTVSGEIRSFNLKTYQTGPTIQCHAAAVLILIVRSGLIISGSGDSLVKVWTIDEASGKISLLVTSYCLVDVGDIFCVELIGSTVYLGTQNASVHWFDLPSTKPTPSPPPAHASLHPAVRPNRFFDSTGPGGRMAPQQYHTKRLQSLMDIDSTLNEINVEAAVNFAHNGFIYSMCSTTIDKSPILITGSSDGTIKGWSVKSGLEELWCVDVEDSVLGLCLFNSWQLYGVLESGDIVIIDLETQQKVKRHISVGVPLLTLSVINDTAYIASGKTLLRFDPITKVSLEWDVSDEITATIALKTRANLLVTASRDGSVAVWNVNDTLRCSAKQQRYSNVALLDLSLDDDSMIEALSHLISYRSVSREDKLYWDECRNCAALLRDIIRQLGGESDLIKVEDGNPIVYARFRAQKTTKRPAKLLFYGHYDVIDADASKWDSPPFELVSGNGYLYGRGTSDNKGPVVAAIFAVGQLYTAGLLENDITFMIEGEEERGSMGFQKTIQDNLSKFGHSFDWIVFSNTYWIDDTSPCLNYGLRGVVFFDLEVKNNKADLHSGVDGGVHREPIHDIVKLLSSLMDTKSNEILIPGFKDNVLEIGDSELRHFDEIIAANPSFSKQDLIRRWTSPSLTVHSVNVSGPDDASVIPSLVTAKISLRIVPNQTTAEVEEKTRSFILSTFEALESPNKLGVKCVYGAEPWLADVENEPYGIMKEALEEEWGVEPLFVREGGSIPVVRGLEKLFNAPAAQLPCGQSSDAAHLQNERLRVTNFSAARKVFKRLFNGVRERQSECEVPVKAPAPRE